MKPAVAEECEMDYLKSLICCQIHLLLQTMSLGEKITLHLKVTLYLRGQEKQAIFISYIVSKKYYKLRKIEDPIFVLKNLFVTEPILKTNRTSFSLILKQ